MDDLDYDDVHRLAAEYCSCCSICSDAPCGDSLFDGACARVCVCDGDNDVDDDEVTP